MRRKTSILTRQEGQALILVALTLGILVALIVGVNAIAFARRTQARVQNSLDQAAATAAVQLDTTTLIADTPRLNEALAESVFRTTLQAGLTRVAAAITPDPAILAQQAEIRAIAAGETCLGRAVVAPAVCASLTVTVPGVFGPQTRTFTTLALVVRQP